MTARCDPFATGACREEVAHSWQAAGGRLFVPRYAARLRRRGLVLRIPAHQLHHQFASPGSQLEYPCHVTFLWHAALDYLPEGRLLARGERLAELRQFLSRNEHRFQNLLNSTFCLLIVTLIQTSS